MRASENLLRTAIAKCEGDLQEYYRHHLAEESGHLAMLERDLSSLGVKRILKFSAAAQLAGAQYYYIEHDHPAMLLGYMAALECIPKPLASVDQLEAEHGLLTCIRHHAVHDVAHGRELHEQINRLPEDLKAFVLANEEFVSSDLRLRCVPMVQDAARYFEGMT